MWEITSTGVNSGITANGVQGFNLLQGYTVHEMGHWADYLMRKSNNTTVTVLSNSPFYQKEIAKDWSNLNLAANTPCQTSQHQGVFSGQADGKYLASPGAKPYYICNGSNGGTGYNSNGGGTALNTGYSGNNQTVLQTAWQYFFKPGVITTIPPYEEIFAETVAAQYGPGAGGAAPANWDAYYGQVYAIPRPMFCAEAWVYYVTTNGKVPTASSNYFGTGNPNSCPTS
jgi:hypothetical protein